MGNENIHNNSQIAHSQLQAPKPLLSNFRIAVNGHPDLYTLLDEAILLQNKLPVELIKCPLSAQATKELHRASKYGSTLLHGWGPSGYSILSQDIPEPEQLRFLASSSHSPSLSVHLQLLPERQGELSDHEIRQRLRHNAPLLRQISGLPLLLENMPYLPEKAQPRYISDPEFIKEALELAEADLLLDLAHARIAAFRRHENIFGYLRRFPLNKVRELHISGPRLNKHGLQDSHLTLGEADWEILQWILPQLPKLSIVTHEYMGMRQASQHHAADCTPEALLNDILQLEQLRQAHTNNTDSQLVESAQTAKMSKGVAEVVGGTPTGR